MIKLVLDTNVLVSGIFWSGVPAKIIDAWHKKTVKVICSLEILDEYNRVIAILVKKHPSRDISSFINLMMRESELFSSPKLKESVSRDPDDDKFIAAAIAAKCNLIVSGDNDLLTVTGYAGIQIITPNKFVKQYLE